MNEEEIKYLVKEKTKNVVDKYMSCFNDLEDNCKKHNVSYYEFINNFLFYKNREEDSVVYFIRNNINGLLKIGKANDLSKRIHEIENNFIFCGYDKPILTLEFMAYCGFGINPLKVETYYHNAFKDRKRNGEWFDISYDEIINSGYFIIDDFYNGVGVSIEDLCDYDNMDKYSFLENNKVNLENYIIKKVISNMNHERYIKTIKDFENFIEKRNKYNLSIINDIDKETIINIPIEKEIENKIFEILSNINNEEMNL